MTTKPDSLTSLQQEILVDEESLKNDLINRILVFTFILMSIGFIALQFRATDIDRGIRDWIQVATYVQLLVTTVIRHKLSSHIKLSSLMFFILANGAFGFISIGPAGTAAFLFAVATMLASVFYRKRALNIFMGVCIFFVALSGFSFITGYSSLPNPEFLMQSPFVWGTYLVGFSYLILVSGYAIFEYRKVNDMLLNHVRQQRDLLHHHAEELENAMAEIRTLKGTIAICSYCHKIKNEEGAWKALESYISDHSDAKFSHGICPTCKVEAEKEI